MHLPSHLCRCPRTTNRQAVLPVNCLSCWRTPLVGFILISQSVAHLLAILARTLVSGCFCCFLAYDHGFLQALCRLQPCPLLPNSISPIRAILGNFGFFNVKRCRVFFLFAVHGWAQALHFLLPCHLLRFFVPKLCFHIKPRLTKLSGSPSTSLLNWSTKSLRRSRSSFWT